MCSICFLFFFFSSRRLHTRYWRDCSSDVCSSDLVEERLSLLEEDFRTSENVESQLALYGEDMERDFEARLAEIENIVLKMGERGDEWLEENIRLLNEIGRASCRERG